MNFIPFFVIKLSSMHDTCEEQITLFLLLTATILQSSYIVI
jgi:hypothetical protein